MKKEVLTCMLFCTRMLIRVAQVTKRNVAVLWESAIKDPMADGSIHPDDMNRYQEFGQEIERRFNHPVAHIEKVADNEVVSKLNKPCKIGYTDVWEEYKCGLRIRAYEIEGREAATGK